MMTKRAWSTAAALLLLYSCSTATAFTNTKQSTIPTQLNAKSPLIQHVGTFLASALLVSSSLVSPVCWADEYGVETEAPTLFTGETVMICKKRGPLGACVEQVERTPENDNDKAAKYFREPKVSPRVVASDETAVDANELIQRLRQQTLDNKEKNELAVKTQTALNDQSASFGPFDRSVVILNTDGKTFTVLENPQAMRLKKAGFIENRRFVKQPTAEELEEALEAERGGIGGFFKGILGGE